MVTKARRESVVTVRLPVDTYSKIVKLISNRDQPYSSLTHFIDSACRKQLNEKI